MCLLQVTSFAFSNCHQGELFNRMWSLLASFSSLTCLRIVSSSIALPHESPPSLPSVVRLCTENLTSDSYRCLIGSLPGLSELGFYEDDDYYPLYLDNPDSDIVEISQGIRHSRVSLTEIRLEPTRWALYGVLSRASMMFLCKAIADGATRLELIWLYDMTIDEDSLLRLVETCRAIVTMAFIR